MDDNGEDCLVSSEEQWASMSKEDDQEKAMQSGLLFSLFWTLDTLE